MTKIVPIVLDPHFVTANPYNCMDTGGWYLTSERSRTIKAIDADLPYQSTTKQDIETERKISRSVTEAINGGEIQWDMRLHETRAAKKVLL